MGLAAGQEILVADTPEDFARALIGFMNRKTFGGGSQRTELKNARAVPSTWHAETGIFV
jgi:hypothetical protein